MRILNGRWRLEPTSKIVHIKEPAAFNAERDETSAATDSRYHAEPLFLDQMEGSALLYFQHPSHLLLRGDQSDGRVGLVLLCISSRSELFGWR